jgi:hypothetical protein
LNQFHSIWLYVKALIAARKIIRKDTIHAFYFVTPASSFGHIRDWFLLGLIANKATYKFGFIHNGNIYNVLNKKWHKRITLSFIKRGIMFCISY